MNYKWVKNTYTGKKADSVLGHAAAGIGYIILKSSKDGVEAAFRVAENQELSYTMEDMDEYESEKMDRTLFRKQGLHQEV